MTFDEIKALVLFARQNRIQNISVGDVSFQFFERSPRSKRPRVEIPADKPAVAAPKVPGLDEINRFIYENPEDQTQ